jgi:predicted Abi (CAAX) family protease
MAGYERLEAVRRHSGTGCALMRYRTGSIWPAVILHGLLVWAWQVFFGGPDIERLLHQAAHI